MFSVITKLNYNKAKPESVPGDLEQNHTIRLKTTNTLRYIARASTVTILAYKTIISNNPNVNVVSCCRTENVRNIIGFPTQGFLALAEFK